MSEEIAEGKIARSVMVLDESFAEAGGRLNDFVGKEVLRLEEYGQYLRRRRELFEGGGVGGHGHGEDLDAYVIRRTMLLDGRFSSLCVKAEEVQVSQLASASMRRAVTAERIINKDPRFRRKREEEGGRSKEGKNLELKLVHIKHWGEGVSKIALGNLSSNFVAVGHTAGSLTLMECMSGKVLGRVKAHEGKVTSVQVSSHNNFVATTGDDGTCRVWIVGEGVARGEEDGEECVRLCSQVAFKGRVGGCLMLPPHSQVGMSNEFENFCVVSENDETGKFGFGGRLHVIDCLRGGIRQTVEVGAFLGVGGSVVKGIGGKGGRKIKVGSMAFDKRGGRLYASLSNGKVEGWRVDREAWVGWSGEGEGKFLKGRWGVGRGKEWVEFVQMNYSLYSPTSSNPSLVCVARSSSLRVVTLPPEGTAHLGRKSSVTRVTKRLGKGGKGEGVLEEEFMDNCDRVQCCACVGELTGKVVAGGTDGRVTVFHGLGEGRERFIVTGMHGGRVEDIKWTRDEGVVVSGDVEGDVCVWRVWRKGEGGEEGRAGAGQRGERRRKKGGGVMREWTNEEG